MIWGALRGLALAAGFGLAAAALFWLSWALIDPPSWGQWKGEATILAYFLPGIVMFGLLMAWIRRREAEKRRQYIALNRRRD
jgi:Zn-dependent protease with chaperone function